VVDVAPPSLVTAGGAWVAEAWAGQREQRKRHSITPASADVDVCGRSSHYEFIWVWRQIAALGAEGRLSPRSGPSETTLDQSNPKPIVDRKRLPSAPDDGCHGTESRHPSCATAVLAAKDPHQVDDPEVVVLSQVTDDLSIRRLRASTMFRSMEQSASERWRRQALGSKSSSGRSRMTTTFLPAAVRRSIVDPRPILKMLLRSVTFG